MTMDKFIRANQKDEPAITIRKNGSISINHHAVERFPIKDQQYATLHFGKAERQIGLKLTNNKNEDSLFKISVERGETPTISCQAFLKSIGIEYEKGSRVYDAEWNEQQEMLMIKLG